MLMSATASAWQLKRSPEWRRGGANCSGPVRSVQRILLRLRRTLGLDISQRKPQPRLESRLLIPAESGAIRPHLRMGVSRRQR